MNFFRENSRGNTPKIRVFSLFSKFFDFLAFRVSYTGISENISRKNENWVFEDWGFWRYFRFCLKISNDLLWIYRIWPSFLKNILGWISKSHLNLSSLKINLLEVKIFSPIDLLVLISFWCLKYSRKRFFFLPWRFQDPNIFFFGILEELNIIFNFFSISRYHEKQRIQRLVFFLKQNAWEVIFCDFKAGLYDLQKKCSAWDLRDQTKV